ncbi:CD276 antigen isoform X2 [Cyclopterus lumpus]|uniref:Ig-like domain-containing protein n=1 Tax=Cyclopterus lumpus TaxID=8103 RepID=A0A8C2X5A5_CYCLU|nr:CD276 antigen isoform X2 [Cyclopterus lumpus]
MNMASMCILLIILFSIENANTDEFISLDCRAEQLGQYGRQSLLECVVKTLQKDTLIRIVSWKKADRNNTDALLVFNEEAIIKQKPGFLFAQPSWDVRNMNVSLLINNTAVEDKGNYTCDVITDRGTVFKRTHLKVTAKYSNPTITLNADKTLTCNSDGGYPKGQLCWFGEGIAELTSNVTTEVNQTAGGLFQLSSRLVVGKESSVSKYTCSVFNASGGLEEKTQYPVMDAPKTEEQEQRKVLDPATRIVAPVVVIGSLIVGLLLALLIYRKRSQSVHLRVPTSDVEDGDDT